MRKTRTIGRSIGLIVSAALVLPALVGCQTSRVAPTAVTPHYVSLYRSGDYAQAYEAAKAFPTTYHGSERLVAGMALAAQGKDQEAKTWLQPLTNSTDREVRGRAKAAMGIILAREKAHGDAAHLLSDASRDLTGPLSGWAAHYGAEAYAEAGDRLRSERLRTIAGQRNPANGVAAADGRYTVQLGSFSSRSRAQSRVKATTPVARNAGLDEPRVEMRISGDRPFYAVRVGRFGSSEAAKQASSAFPGDTAVIRMN